MGEGKAEYRQWKHLRGAVIATALVLLLLGAMLLPASNGGQVWAQTPGEAPPPCGEGTDLPCEEATLPDALPPDGMPPEAPTTAAPPADVPTADAPPADAESAADAAALPMPEATAPQGADPAADATASPPPDATAPGSTVPDSTAAGAPPTTATPDAPPLGQLPPDAASTSPERPDNPLLPGPEMDFIRGEGEHLAWGSDYRNWRQVSGFVLSPAHGNRLVVVYASPAEAAKVFLSNAERVRLRQNPPFKAYPPGTMIAMETWLRTQNGMPGKPGPLFFMRKEPGYDPQGGDWEYGFTRRDMSIIGTGNTGNMAFCQECHRQAGARDFIWATR